MQRALLVIIAALLAPFSFARSARAECGIHRAALLPLTLWQQKLYVRADLNGTPAAFFIDTGAGVTTLSQELAASLSLPRDFDHTADTFGVGGVESHLYLAETRDLALAGIHIANHEFPVASFRQRLADGSAVGGLIGADLLSQFDVDLDVAHRQLGLWRVTGCTEVRPDWPGDAAVADMDIAPSRHVSVPVRIDGASLDLMIDTGSPALILSTRAAARAGATPDILEQNRQLQGHGVNDRPFEAWLHIFRRLDVAGQLFGDVRTVVVAPGRIATGDGLLGLEFLKRGRIWLSYSTAKFFIQKGDVLTGE